MNPYTMQPMERVSVSSSGIDSKVTTTATPFLVGHRLALNSSFAGVDHIDRYSNEEDLQGCSPLVKSHSIPIRNRMKRTPSELQLKEDEELADFRDYCMFSRIVDRMSRAQKDMLNRNLRYENDQCLAHVIGTRNGTGEQVVNNEIQQRTALQVLQERRLINSNDQHARVVSIAEMDNMLAVDEALTAQEQHLEDDDEEDIMFDLEL